MSAPLIALLGNLKIDMDRLPLVLTLQSHGSLISDNVVVSLCKLKVNLKDVMSKGDRTQRARARMQTSSH